MKLKYIDKPNLTKTRQNTKVLVQEIIANAEVGRWVVIKSTKGKTEREYRCAYARVKSGRKLYPALNWSIHTSKTNYTVIAQKTK